MTRSNSIRVCRCRHQRSRSTKRATTEVPIVFAVGSDPVVAGLVETFARPGARFTGVHYSSADLTARHLETLKAILPELRNVVTVRFVGRRDRFEWPLSSGAYVGLGSIAPRKILESGQPVAVLLTTPGKVRQ